MTNGDINRLFKLILKYKNKPRSKKEIKKTFLDMGLIDENNKLKSPYENIYFPI